MKPKKTKQEIIKEKKKLMDKKIVRK